MLHFSLIFEMVSIKKTTEKWHKQGVFLKRGSLVFNNLNHIEIEMYVLVPWPDCQEFMEYQWFYDEAILAVGVENRVGPSVYFIPERRGVSEKYQHTKIS